MRPTLLLPLLVLVACGDETDKSTDDRDDGTTELPEGDDDGSGDAGSGDDGSGDDGSGGDGSGDDGSGDDGGSDLEMGADDAHAAMGCDLLDTEPERLVLGISRAEANTAVIVPDDETAFLLEMPDSGDGWFTVEVPDWMTITRLFTQEGVELEVYGGEGFSEVLLNGACPDAGISDQRWAFHEWGAYNIRVAEGAPAEVWFTLVKEE